MKILVFVTSLLLSLNLHADWKVTEQESMCKTMHKVASTSNDKGDSFSLYRVTDGTVWASITLSDQGKAYAYWIKAPVMQVDKQKPEDLVGMQKMQSLLGIHSYDWTMNKVNFRLWHGNAKSGLSNTLYTLMTGNKLTVQYVLSNGEAKTTTFSLHKANVAIAEALDIEENIDPYTQKLRKKFNFAVITEETQCRLDKDTSETCVQKSVTCKELTSPDVQQYKECLKQY